MGDRIFEDRQDAARKLLPTLEKYRGDKNAILLAIPRGALEMGAVCARTFAWWWVRAGGKYPCADVDDTAASQVRRGDLRQRDHLPVCRHQHEHGLSRFGLRLPPLPGMTDLFGQQAVYRQGCRA